MFILVDTDLLLLKGIQEFLFASFLENFKEFIKNGNLDHPEHFDLLCHHITSGYQIKCL